MVWLELVRLREYGPMYLLTKYWKVLLTISNIIILKLSRKASFQDNSFIYQIRYTLSLHVDEAYFTNLSLNLMTLILIWLDLGWYRCWACMKKKNVEFDNLICWQFCFWSEIFALLRKIDHFDEYFGLLLTQITGNLFKKMHIFDNIFFLALDVE